MSESNSGLTIDFFGATDVGCHRLVNEDRFIATRLGDTEAVFVAAIDGMGGYAGGARAAEMACEIMAHAVTEDAVMVNAADVLTDAFINANNAILAERRADESVGQMGCVATAAIFCPERGIAYVANCGDARMYCFKDGVLTKLTHDHSPVGRMEDAGSLSEEEAMAHPRRNMVDRCLGDIMLTVDDRNYIETIAMAIPGGATDYLLCSDGISDMLPSSRIAEVFSSTSTAEEAAMRLIELARDAGGRDNITAVVVRIVNSTVTETGAEIESTTVTATSEADCAPTRAEKHRGQKFLRSAGRGVAILAWVLVVIALAVILLLALRKYTGYDEKLAEPMDVNESTVVVDVENELEAVEIDSVSSIVRQARDSMNVEIPRYSSTQKKIK